MVHGVVDDWDPLEGATVVVEPDGAFAGVLVELELHAADASARAATSRTALRVKTVVLMIWPFLLNYGLVLLNYGLVLLNYGLDAVPDWILLNHRSAIARRGSALGCLDRRSQNGGDIVPVGDSRLGADLHHRHEQRKHDRDHAGGGCDRIYVRANDARRLVGTELLGAALAKLGESGDVQHPSGDFGFQAGEDSLREGMLGERPEDSSDQPLRPVRDRLGERSGDHPFDQTGGVLVGRGEEQCLFAREVCVRDAAADPGIASDIGNRRRAVAVAPEPFDRRIEDSSAGQSPFGAFEGGHCDHCNRIEDLKKYLKNSRVVSMTEAQTRQAQTGQAHAEQALAGQAQTKERKVPTRRVALEASFEAVPRHFAEDGDLFSSHFTAALSALFPDGEDFFVRSVRHYRDRIDDPVLKRQVAGFIGQEAMHGREHRAFNERLDQLGYHTKLVEGFVRRGLRFRQKVAPPITNLAVTAALEHFTATMAELLLTSEETRHQIGHEAVHDLFVWHALEESEHKAVAFDVYRAVGGSEKLRVATMKAIRVGFAFVVALEMLGSLATDPATYRRGNLLRSWRRFRRSPIVQPAVWKQLKEYDRPQFHPDDRDTTELVETWRERLFGERGSMSGKLVSAA
jgi:predicted metal-dependent hydrolase